MDGSDLENVQLINQMIKKRDFWMPFAPVILDKSEKDYCFVRMKRKPYIESTGEYRTI